MFTRVVTVAVVLASSRTIFWMLTRTPIEFSIKSASSVTLEASASKVTSITFFLVCLTPVTCASLSVTTTFAMLDVNVPAVATT